jgi:hypothetical protein
VEPDGGEDNGFSFRQFKVDEPIILDQPKEFTIDFVGAPNVYR